MLTNQLVDPAERSYDINYSPHLEMFDPLPLAAVTDILSATNSELKIATLGIIAQESIPPRIKDVWQQINDITDRSRVKSLTHHNIEKVIKNFPASILSGIDTDDGKRYVLSGLGSMATSWGGTSLTIGRDHNLPLRNVWGESRSSASPATKSPNAIATRLLVKFALLQDREIQYSTDSAKVSGELFKEYAVSAAVANVHLEALHTIGLASKKHTRHKLPKYKITPLGDEIIGEYMYHLRQLITWNPSESLDGKIKLQRLLLDKNTGYQIIRSTTSSGYAKRKNNSERTIVEALRKLDGKASIDDVAKVLGITPSSAGRKIKSVTRNTDQSPIKTSTVGRKSILTLS